MARIHKPYKQAINRGLIEKIASNARLNLTEAEIKEFLPQLREIIKMFSALDKINTKNEKPAIHPIEAVNIFRTDDICPSVLQDSALKNTKHKKDGFFVAPKTI